MTVVVRLRAGVTAKPGMLNTLVISGAETVEHAEASFFAAMETFGFKADRSTHEAILVPPGRLVFDSFLAVSS